MRYDNMTDEELVEFHEKQERDELVPFETFGSKADCMYALRRYAGEFEASFDFDEAFNNAFRYIPRLAKFVWNCDQDGLNEILENNDIWRGAGWYTQRTWVHNDGRHTVEDWDSPELPLAIWLDDPSELGIEGGVPEGCENVVTYYGDGRFPDNRVDVDPGCFENPDEAEIWDSYLRGELPAAPER